MQVTPVIFRYARAIIGFTIVLGSFGFLFLLCYRAIPESNKDTVQTATGFVLGLLTAVGAYYFGSSKDKSDSDSAARDTTTTTSINTVTPPAPVTELPKP